MSESEEGSPGANSPTRPGIPLKRRLVYALLIYLTFVLVLLTIEAVTRARMDHVSSLDLFVVTPQQKAQVADAKQSTIFEGDPLLLWRLKPNLDHVVWDFTVVSTNGDHLRSGDPNERIKPKQPGTLRILCVGDSVTFGYRVPTVWPEKPAEYDREWLPFPMLLEKHLRAANPERTIEVITMAVPGYTSHQGLAWLKRNLNRLDPDLIIVSFGWNDVSFSDAPDREAINTGWRAFGIRWLVDHSQAFAHATRWLRSRPQAVTIKRKPVARVSEPEYLNNFQEIIRLAKGRGTQVMVIGATYRDRTTNPPEAALMGQYRTALRSLVQQNDVPFLEVLELTEAAYPSNEGWFGELIHPNHMGHRLIASELLKLLATKRILTDTNIPTLVP
ncbi:MAG TPA: GDSL-type esterase/lipase family protein [Pyrinomonadaceae bacterium]|nr:GDSL-type esterase/lipase family protein [Pyrinomonadaceae bacterium]